jgi:hypothetical protein
MSDSTKAKLGTLATQRAAIVDELKKLTKGRAKARLDGAQFDGAGRIDELNRELQVVDETIALAGQMERDDEDREISLAQADSIERQIGELESLRDVYLSAMTRLEAAATELAAAMDGIHRIAPQISSVGTSLTGERNLPDFEKANYEHRLLARISEAMGDNMWPLAQYRMPVVDYQKLLPVWADEEARRFSNLLGTPMLKARKRVEQLREAAASIGADV